jgi:hypothetical protein
MPLLASLSGMKNIISGKQPKTSLIVPTMLPSTSTNMPAFLAFKMISSFGHPPKRSSIVPTRFQKPPSIVQAADLQDDLTFWKSAEAVLDRAHKVSENALDRTAKSTLQDDQQTWASAEAVSWIGPTKFLKPLWIVPISWPFKMISSYGHPLKKSSTVPTRFPKLPSIVPPGLALQDDQQTWASAEAVLNRALQVSEAALDRASKEGLQDDLLVWKAAQAVLDRAHQVSESCPRSGPGRKTDLQGRSLVLEVCRSGVGSCPQGF